jgi:type I restriction enzyme S subunit
MTAPQGGTTTKQRGTEFLDGLPSHWDLRPAVSLARVLTSNVDKNSVPGQVTVHLCNYTDVYYSDEVAAGRDFMLATATKDQARLFAVRAGDVAITKDSETADDIGISAYVPRSIPDLVYGYHLAIYRPHDIRYGKFLKWLFDSSYAKAYFETRTFGVTRVGLSQNTLRYIRIPTPPPEEAKAISDYLDLETAEIDAFISDHEELIRLLTERRISTISHAVTRGLHPRVATKYSGVEWLGEIPEDWSTCRLKDVAHALIGLTYAPDDVSIDEAATIVLRSGNVQNGQIDVAKDVVRVSRNVPARLRTRVGDILICARNGSRDLVGKNALIDQRSAGMTFGAFMTVVRSPESRYLYWVLNSSVFHSQKGLFSTSTVNQLTQEVLLGLNIPWPTAFERAEIERYLDREVNEIDASISDARECIGLMRERRAALISAAVTGKIDVRERARGA